VINCGQRNVLAPPRNRSQRVPKSFGRSISGPMVNGMEAQVSMTGCRQCSRVIGAIGRRFRCRRHFQTRPTAEKNGAQIRKRRREKMLDGSTVADRNYCRHGTHRGFCPTDRGQHWMRISCPAPLKERAQKELAIVCHEVG
jgi:hypothetical protein